MNKRKTPKSNLENQRIIFLEIGFIITLASVLYALEYKIFDRITDLKNYYNNYQEEEELPPLVLKEKEILPERPKPQTIINIVDDEIEIDEDISIDVMDIPSDPAGDWIFIEKPDIVEDDPIPFYAASLKPEFPGGEPAMLKFLAQHYKIPRLDKEMGNQGKIYVAFVIDHEGYVKDVHIERSLSPTADAEAIRIINMMPRWKPGQQGIKNVPVSLIIPIHVKLM